VVNPQCSGILIHDVGSLELDGVKKIWANTERDDARSAKSGNQRYRSRTTGGICCAQYNPARADARRQSRYGFYGVNAAPQPITLVREKEESLLFNNWATDRTA